MNEKENISRLIENIPSQVAKNTLARIAYSYSQHKLFEVEHELDMILSSAKEFYEQYPKQR